MKFKKTLLTVCIIACVLFGITSVMAGDVNETVIADEDCQETILKTNDETAMTSDNEQQKIQQTASASEEYLSDTLTVGGGKFSDIQTSIDNAKSGDTISLSGTYIGSGSHIKIGKALSIEGNGATLDAKGLSKIFEITAENVKLNNISFINGNSTSSGAIDWWNGGSEKQSNGLLTNCIFTDCHAQYYAGAVYFCTNSLTMYNCKFYNNNAYKGGAVYVSGNDCIIEGCEFYENSVNYDLGNNIVACGGAIVLEGKHHIIDRCIFEGNTINMGTYALNFDYYDDGPEDKYGAAIRIVNDNDSNILISNSEFNNKFRWYKFYTPDPNTLFDCKTSSNIVSDSPYYLAKDTCSFNSEEYGGIGIGSNYNDVNLKNTSVSFQDSYYNTGSDINMTINVKTGDGNAAGQGKLLFGVDGKYYINEVANGLTDFIIPNLEVGSYPYEIIYVGDGNYSSCVSKGSLKINKVPTSSSGGSKTVKKLTPKLTAKAATFKVKIKTKKYSVILKTNKNKVIKNVKVYLKVNKKTYTAKTNSKGKATFKITKLKKKGTYKATITYKGNTNYNKVTKTVKIRCK